MCLSEIKGVRKGLMACMRDCVCEGVCKGVCEGCVSYTGPFLALALYNSAIARNYCTMHHWNILVHKILLTNSLGLWSTFVVHLVPYLATL